MKTAKYFYDSIFPSLAISVILGISPIFVATHGNKRKLYTSKSLYFINIIYIIIFAVLVLRTISETKSNVMSNNYYKQNKVSNIGIGFVFTSGIIYVFIIYICGFLRTESIKNTLERVANLDKIFDKLGQKFKYRQSIIYQISTQLAALALIAFITAMQHENVHREHFRQLSNTTWFVFVFPAIAVNAFENQFVYTILLIYQRFKMINSQLRNISAKKLKVEKHNKVFPISEKPSDFNITIPHKINILMRIHDELCDIARIVNRNYTLQEVVVLMFQFGILLFSVFYSYWMFSTKPFSAICWILWSSLKSTEVLHVTISCHLASNQARKTGDVIHKLLITANDPETKSQLLAFSNQILHRRVNFTIWGMLTLNTTLLFTMVAAASTYIVIMLQFQQASLPMTCKANMPLNITTISPTRH